MRLWKKGKGSAIYESLIIQKFIVMYWKMVVSMESKQTNYILHILYTNSKFSIDLPYNSADLLPGNKHNLMLLIKQPVRIG